MLILIFEEFNKKFNIDNNAMSDIRIKDIGKDISLTPIEIVMRDGTPDNIIDLRCGFANNNFNIIVILHPTDRKHWVLVIRREDGPTYYFHSSGVEIPPLFLEEYVDLGSNERIQQYDESFCGAYCLYVIYLIDRGFRNKSALNILVNQVKCPEIYNECFCLGCSKDLRSSFANNDEDNDKVNDNDIDNDEDNDLRSSFAINDNDNDKDNDSVKDNVNDKDNQGTCFADYLRSSITINDNDQRRSFANNDNVNVNDNDNKYNVIDNDNDLRSSFANNNNENDKDLRSSFTNQGTDGDRGVPTCTADNDNVIYKFDEKHQKCKPNIKECPTNTISINKNEDLQS